MLVEYHHVGGNQKMDKTPVENTYKGGFFKNRHRLSWRAPIVGEALVKTFDLEAGQSVVDVGCAIGDYVKWFDDNGYEGWGIEGSAAAEEFMVTGQVTIWDLREILFIKAKDKKFDLAFSLEVAEHIEPFYSDIYIQNLCLLSNTVLISAASPGQKGHGHVNCVTRQFWIDAFKRHNYINMKGFENRWREALVPYRTKKELSSYFKNVICFRRKGS